MPKLPRALAKEQAAKPLHPTSTVDQSCLMGKLPLKGLFQAIFPWDCQLKKYSFLLGVRQEQSVAPVLSSAVVRMPAYVREVAFGCSTALTKAMVCLEGLNHFTDSIPTPIASATDFRN
ncbi:hypothetical protein NQZ68_040199 [Dissostichus eleginoides]|nr:hypothetical protein NQZ68_040199 [Dissostichus eleginoides]